MFMMPIRLIKKPMNNQINGISPHNKSLGIYMEAGRGVAGYLSNLISNEILYWTGNQEAKLWEHGGQDYIRMI